MSVVQNISQIEAAIRRRDSELLVVGKLGQQIVRALAEPGRRLENEEKLRSYLSKIKAEYRIKLRQDSRYVPVVFSRI